MVNKKTDILLRLKPLYFPIGQAIVQLLFLTIFPFIIIKFIDDSTFVIKCTSQYGRIILSLLLTGLLSSGISFYERAKKKGVSTFSTAVSLLSAAAIGIASVLTWKGDLDNNRILSLEFWVLILALLSAIVSITSIRKNENKAYFTNLLFYVDIPLFVGCLIIVLFKQFYFNESSEAFIEFFVKEMPPNDANTPYSYAQNGKIQNLLRENFWLGFSTGVVTIQLITTQFVSIVINLTHSLKSPKKNES